jgi:hypothetical protein
LQFQKIDTTTTAVIWDVPAPVGLQSDWERNDERNVPVRFGSPVGSISRTDHVVALSVVALWYGIHLFERFLFRIGRRRGDTPAFLKGVLQKKQIDNETSLWNPSDDIGLLQSQIDLGFYCRPPEFYREAARTSNGSYSRALFSVGGPLPNSPILRYPFHSARDEFDLPLTAAQTVSFLLFLHEETAADTILG